MYPQTWCRVCSIFQLPSIRTLARKIWSCWNMFGGSRTWLTLFMFPFWPLLSSTRTLRYLSTASLPLAVFANLRESIKGVGPTPVLQTQTPKGMTSPVLRTASVSLNSFTMPWNMSTHFSRHPSHTCSWSRLCHRIHVQNPSIWESFEVSKSPGRDSLICSDWGQIYPSKKVIVLGTIFLKDIGEFLPEFASPIFQVLRLNVANLSW